MGSFSWRSCLSGRGIAEGQKIVLLLPDDSIIRGTYMDMGEIDDGKGPIIDVFCLYAANWNVEEGRRISDLDNTGPKGKYGWNEEKHAARYLGISDDNDDYRIGGYLGPCGCGFKFFRTREYKRGMKYKDFPASFECPDQGWLSLNSKNVVKGFNEFNELWNSYSEEEKERRLANWEIYRDAHKVWSKLHDKKDKTEEEKQFINVYEIMFTENPCEENKIKNPREIQEEKRWEASINFYKLNKRFPTDEERAELLVGIDKEEEECYT